MTRQEMKSKKLREKGYAWSPAVPFAKPRYQTYKNMEAARKDVRSRALLSYKRSYLNHLDENGRIKCHAYNKLDLPSRKFPCDGKYSELEFCHTDGYMDWYRIKYTGGPRDRAWLQECYRNLSERIAAAEGKKQETLVTNVQAQLELEKLRLQNEALRMKLELARIQAQQGGTAKTSFSSNSGGQALADTKERSFFSRHRDVGTL